MSSLPKVPSSENPSDQRRYIVKLVQELERQLRNRPVSQAGNIYITDSLGLRIISPNGTVYELTVDDAGTLVTTEIS